MSIIDTTVDKELIDLVDSVFGQAADSGEDFRSVWGTLTELGLARLTGSEESGGSGAGWGEAAALLSGAAGKGVPMPYVESDLLAGWLLEQVGLPVDESVRSVAIVDAEGRGQRVAWAREADSLVVVAPRGEGWAVADVPASDVTVTDYPTLGREPRANVEVPASALADAKDLSAEQMDAFYLRGALARSLQTVAALETAADLAKEYVVTRHQFGRPLAKFQSVQNLIVDAVAEVTLARSAVDEALSDALEHDLAGPDSVFRVAVAKSVVGRAASVVVRNTHQALGAIGTTEEHSLHRYTNAALTWRSEFGSVRSWEEAFGAAAAAGSVDDVWAFVVGAGPVTAPAVSR